METLIAVQLAGLHIRRAGWYSFEANAWETDPALTGPALRAKRRRAVFERFPDQEAARIYLEGRLWPSGPICPQCHSGAPPKTPPELDLIADIVLNYKPKPKTKAQRKRARKAKKNAKSG